MYQWYVKLKKLQFAVSLAAQNMSLPCEMQIKCQVRLKSRNRSVAFTSDLVEAKFVQQSY